MKRIHKNGSKSKADKTEEESKTQADQGLEYHYREPRSEAGAKAHERDVY